MKCGTHHDGILSVSPVNSSWLGNHYAFEFFSFLRTVHTAWAVLARLIHSVGWG